VEVLREDGFGFDLDAPLGVEQCGDDHGGGGADVGEDFAVGAADLLPVFGAGEEDAGADDVLEGLPAPAWVRAFSMMARTARVCSAGERSSAPTGPVPETWTTLPMRTAREKPMMGS
jgi:hypothetical protein